MSGSKMSKKVKTAAALILMPLFNDQLGEASPLLFISNCKATP
jgi:hypothetical protein